MNEKVKLINSEAIYIQTRREHFLEDGLTGAFNDMSVIEFIVQDSDYTNKEKLKLINAVLNGYEIEQTPEECIKECYLTVEEDAEKGRDNIGKTLAFNSGITFTLNTLGILIKGVNA